MQPSPAAIRRVQALARDALRVEVHGAPGARGDDTAGARPRGPEVLAAAGRHRVTELLHEQAGALGLEAELGTGAVTALAGAHSAARRGVIVQLMEVGRLLTLFEDAGVPVLVLKGPVLAVQSRGVAWARGYGDIDLFVGPESVEDSRRLLLDNGWEPRPIGSALPGTWAWRYLIRSFNEMTFDGRASTVDLHWRLDPAPGVLPEFAEAWDRRSVIEVGGVTVPTLDIETAFLHSCQHAAKDDWRWLRSLVDVHRLLTAPQVRALVDRSATTGHLSGQVWATLAVTEHLLGLPELPTAAVRRRLRGHRAAIRRAERMQERAAYTDRPVPTLQSFRDLRYRLAAARTVGSVVTAMVATALPAKSLAGIVNRSGWVAVPRLVARRAWWLATQWLHWAGGEPSGPGGIPVRRDPASRRRLTGSRR